MTNSITFNEEEILQDLGPKAADFVRNRIKQELSAIQKERNRVIHTMKDEVLHMKQRLLYDLCAKMQNVAYSDHANIEMYKDKCPDLFTRFPQKGAKKRMRKKPKLQKLNIPFSSLNHHLDTSSMLMDLACVTKETEAPKACDDPFVKMTTNNGQQWLVQKTNHDSNLTKLKYCDGSSSAISNDDMETLKIHFSPIDN